MKRLILLLIALTIKINCEQISHLEVVQINKITNQPEIVDELTQKLRDEVLRNLSKKVKKETHPVLYETISDLAKKMNIKMPETIYIFKANGICDINAFAASFSKSIVGIGQKLILGYPYKETRAVIAHELAHIKSNDTKKDLSKIFLFWLIRKIFYNSIYKEIKSPFLKDVTSASFELGLTLIFLKMNRIKEKKADLYAAKFIDPKDLISFFEKDKKTRSKWNNLDNLKLYSKILPYPFCYLVKKVIPLFYLHPSYKERIKYLKEEAERQESELRALT